MCHRRWHRFVEKMPSAGVDADYLEAACIPAEERNAARGNPEVSGENLEQGGIRLAIHRPLLQEHGEAILAGLHERTLCAAGFDPHGDIHHFEL
jgi:hypothetical protein